jgi:hypothetical protein
VLDAAGDRTDMALPNSTITSSDEIVISNIGDDLLSATMEPEKKMDLAYYEVLIPITSFSCTFCYSQVALYISTLLLGISAVGHAIAFAVKKVEMNRRRGQANLA